STRRNYAWHACRRRGSKTLEFRLLKRLHRPVVSGDKQQAILEKTSRRQTLIKNSDLRISIAEYTLFAVQLKVVGRIHERTVAPECLHDHKIRPVGRHLGQLIKSHTIE